MLKMQSWKKRLDVGLICSQELLMINGMEALSRFVSENEQGQSDINAVSSTHVEAVCLLSKLHEAKHHVNVTLDMGELDLMAAEKKATYQEIKDYVSAHSGLKVSSLYISQIKRKCGLDVGDSYNKPKSEDAKQPQCPPEKEEVIKEALRHFWMI